MNRQKILAVHPHLFLDFHIRGFKGELEIINPIPEDAKFVRVYQDGIFGVLHIVIESESFPELKDGDEIPLIAKPMFNKK